MNWMPIPLHIKHDNVKPYQKSFTLNPKEHRPIDLISAVQGRPSIDIVHTIEGIDNKIPVRRYRLTAQATGKDVSPSIGKFEIWTDGSGALRCVAL
jgi:hypothetical protein